MGIHIPGPGTYIPAVGAGGSGFVGCLLLLVCIACLPFLCNTLHFNQVVSITNRTESPITLKVNATKDGNPLSDILGMNPNKGGYWYSLGQITLAPGEKRSYELERLHAVSFRWECGDPNNPHDDCWSPILSGSNPSNYEIFPTTGRALERNETQPSFPGGTQGLTNYLKHKAATSNCRSPLEWGTVGVQFTIGPDGKASRPMIMTNTVDSYYTFYVENCAKRIILEMPNWTPATSHGTPTWSTYELQIHFTGPK